MFIKNSITYTVFLFVLAMCCVFGIQHTPRANPLALDQDALISALKRGGHILYFRHAQTDWTQNDQVAAVGDWWSCSPAEMRQLTDEGRETARSIGMAIQKLSIPIGNIYSSEYCRSRETAQQFGLGEVVPSRKIMNLRAAEFIGGREKVIEEARSALQLKPIQGTNTIWVAHGNIVRAATGEYPGEAGCVIFRHGNDGSLQVVGRLTPQDWMDLAGNI